MMLNTEMTGMKTLDLLINKCGIHVGEVHNPLQISIKIPSILNKREVRERLEKQFSLSSFPNSIWLKLIEENRHDTVLYCFKLPSGKPLSWVLLDAKELTRFAVPSKRRNQILVAKKLLKMLLERVRKS